MKAFSKHYLIISFLLIILILISIISLIYFPTVLNFENNVQPKTKLLHIVLKIRLPEILIAITAGSCLGLSGAVMQIILGNPLASPFTLGISSSSAFGAALAIILGANTRFAFVNAGIFSFMFSCGSVFLMLFLVSCSGISKRNIILVGMAVNFFFNSSNTLLQYYASPDAVYQIMFWATGSLTNASLKDSIVLGIVFLFSLAVSILLSKDLATISQGEKTALMLGINVNAERVGFLVICSLLASATVAIVGMIGFIGLVAPHIARLFDLKQPKFLVISSPIIGAVFLVCADIFSKSILYPTVLPISAVTSVIGIPCLLLLLLFSRNRRS